MGGKGSGQHNKRYNIPGLGQLKMSTVVKLIDKGILRVSHTLPSKDFDAIIVDDSNNPIIIKGIKKILEIE